MASRAARSWGPALAGALAVHAAMVLAVILTVTIGSPPREPPPFIVQLIQPWRPPPKPDRLPPPRDAAPQASPLSTRAPTVLPAPPSAVPAGTTAAPGPDVPTKLRGMLRGSVGCADMDRFHLSPEERARCAKLLQAHLDPGLHLEVAIDPAKRAWYDASVRAHELNGRMPMGPPGLGNAAVKIAGVGGVPGTTAGHEVKLGPLSIGLPPGSFNDDDAPPPQH